MSNMNYDEELKLATPGNEITPNPGESIREKIRDKRDFSPDEVAVQKYVY